MKQHEFEELWLKRDELNDEVRAELEQFARQDRHAKAFVEGGWKVHNLLREQPGAVADPGLAYRMKIYAVNHLKEGDSPIPHRGGWMRWPAVSGGLVAGAMLVLFGFGPFTGTQTQPAGTIATSTQVESATQAGFQASAVEQPVAVPELAQEQTPAEAIDSSQVQESGPRVQEHQPHWDMRAVGTAE